ncbi:glycosyltransferase [Shewanella sp. SNU WT4]|uniref:glycosyltransferase n=1 Tax=Shewanella sp. SNU WT4 TaxID=2590015 RepID=UPI00112E6076|nr:glycosyltransferase [Shewanella sp. SNU WT4]QDF67643.1 glycosyltransferase [Shewanella sp. SNU WT4]
MLMLLESPNTENDVIKHWKYTDKVYVSVVCPTYNQDIYIKNAVDSFLSQVTEYRFEIIVHDDASTDNTKSILNSYKSKYPSLIKVITQIDNQFSININMPFKHCLDIAQGEYIALCEGDDFWYTNDKLQKQIKELEDNKGYNIVISSAVGLSNDGSYNDFCNIGQEKLLIPFANCILGPRKDFYPTASFFFRKSALNHIPSWFYNAPVCDYYVHLFCSYPNGCIYLPEKTVVYRLSAVGSLSSLMDKNKFIVLKNRSYDCILKLNDMYSLDNEAKLAIKNKKIEYLFSLFLVSLQLKDYRNAISYLFKSTSVSLVSTINFFCVQLVSLIKGRLSR